MVIGVLALQGDFKEHMASLRSHGVEGRDVRTPADLKEVNALILPGGESTTMAKLLISSGLNKEIVQRAKKKMPIWGTCAGAILLATDVVSPVPLECTLGLLDMTVERNSYGRQLNSFLGQVEGLKEPFDASFIRAPRISRLGRGVRVLARCRKDRVMMREKNILATTFHTELGGENKVLEYFLSQMIEKR
ncbi:MAG: pyridoxal 5'-phosphate synthase glutaminase subunit PdxT [bacterium]|nr:pyridoxal 5'-phosphate synthase glutaminase subunit PdxT [bacterium]